MATALEGGYRIKTSCDNGKLTLNWYASTDTTCSEPINDESLFIRID